MASVTGLTGGWYYVTIGDQNGGAPLYVTDSVYIIEAAQNLVASKFVVNPTCFGDNNGLVDIIVSGGVPGYSYSWSNGATTEDITGLSYTGDTLYITVTDALGCDNSNWAYMVDPPELLVNITLNSPVECQGSLTGELFANTSGGNFPYTFQWNDPGLQTEQLATELEAGTYSVTVTDNTGCYAMDSYILSDADTLTLDTIIGYEPVCFGSATGALAAYASGASGTYTYSWSHTGTNSDSLANQTAGSYFLTVTDINCSESDTSTIILGQPDTISIVSVDTTQIICFGDNTGAITVNVTGGSGSYDFAWGHTGTNSPTVTGLSAGNYNVTISDATTGCTADNEYDEILITEGPELLILDVDSTDVTCNGGSNGSLIVTPTGGSNGVNYRFLWSHNGALDDSTASSLTAGNYSVTVYDDFCTDNVSDFFVIEEPMPLTIASVDSTDVTCNGGSDGQIIVTPNGGSLNVDYRFVWSHNGALDDSTASSLSSGIYSVDVYDDVCSDMVNDAFEILSPNSLSISNIDSSDVTCHGGSDGLIVVTPSGGSTGVNYRFVWSHNGTLDDSTASSLPAATYTVTVYDDICGNQVSDLINISEPQPLVIANIDSVNITCNGGDNGSITVTPTGGSIGIIYRYSWSHDSGLNSDNATNLIAGGYEAKVFDDLCNDSVSQTVSLTEPEAITIDSMDITGIIDQTNGEIIVYASGGVSPLEYAINGGLFSENNIFSDLIAGDYLIEITDANLCGPVSGSSIQIATGLEDFGIGSIQIYPNPAVDNLVIKLSDPVHEDLDLKMVNINGQMVWKGVLKKGDDILRISSLEELSNGVYFILIRNEKISQPVIIQK